MYTQIKILYYIKTHTVLKRFLKKLGLKIITFFKILPVTYLLMSSYHL